MAKHVLIVGAGIVGLSTAYCAARRGHRVTVLDQGTAQRNGCSYGNAGMLVPSHFVPLAAPGMVALGLRLMWNPESPFYVRPRLSGELLGWGLRFWRAANAQSAARAGPLLRDLHLANRERLAAWAALWGDDFGLTTSGLLMLCNTAHGLAEETTNAAAAHALGIPADVLTPAQATELEPGIRMEITGAVHYPMDAHLTPGRLMSVLQGEAERAGVTFRWNTSVTGWSASERRVEAVRTSEGDLTADEYVLCAGVWSATMARGLALNIPMQAGKGYSLTLAEPKRLPRLCAILSEARVAVTPMGRALRVGGTLELCGLDSTVNAARVRGIVRSVTQYLPDFEARDFETTPVWCGLRPCSPDGLPYLGRFTRYANLSAATGHAMMGVSLGAISGVLMGEILSGERPSLDVTALDPNRYC